MKVICLKNYSKSLKIILKDHIKIFFQENILNLTKNSESAMELQRQPLPSLRAPQLSMMAAPLCHVWSRAPFPISSQLGGIRKSRPLTWTASPSAPRCRNWIPSKATQKSGTLSLHSYSSDRRSIPCTAGQEYWNHDQMCPSLLVGQRFCAWEIS